MTHLEFPFRNPPLLVRLFSFTFCSTHTSIPHDKVRLINSQPQNPKHLPSKARMDQQAHWGNYSNPRPLTIESLIQPLDVWSPSPSLPLPQPHYTDLPVEPSLQNHFSATQTQSERVNDANVEDNGMPASLPHNPRMLQGLWQPDTAITQQHGNSSNAVERPNHSSRRPSRRRPKAPAVGELQWEEKRPYIEQLYMKEDLPLSDVIKRMGETHGFHAT